MWIEWEKVKYGRRKDTGSVAVLWYVSLRSWGGASHDKDESHNGEDVKESELHSSGMLN